MAEGPDIAALVGELYAAEPAAFVATRKQLAAQLEVRRRQGRCGDVPQAAQADRPRGRAQSDIADGPRGRRRVGGGGRRRVRRAVGGDRRGRVRIAASRCRRPAHRDHAVGEGRHRPCRRVQGGRRDGAAAVVDDRWRRRVRCAMACSVRRSPATPTSCSPAPRPTGAAARIDHRAVGEAARGAWRDGSVVGRATSAGPGARGGTASARRCHRAPRRLGPGACADGSHVGRHVSSGRLRGREVGRVRRRRSGVPPPRR